MTNPPKTEPKTAINAPPDHLRRDSYYTLKTAVSLVQYDTCSDEDVAVALDLLEVVGTKLERFMSIRHQPEGARHVK